MTRPDLQRDMKLAQQAVRLRTPPPPDPRRRAALWAAVEAQTEAAPRFDLRLALGLTAAAAVVAVLALRTPSEPPSAASPAMLAAAPEAPAPLLLAPDTLPRRVVSDTHRVLRVGALELDLAPGTELELRSLTRIDLHGGALDLRWHDAPLGAVVVATAQSELRFVSGRLRVEADADGTAARLSEGEAEAIGAGARPLVVGEAARWPSTPSTVGRAADPAEAVAPRGARGSSPSTGGRRGTRREDGPGEGSRASAPSAERPAMSPQEAVDEDLGVPVPSPEATTPAAEITARAAPRREPPKNGRAAAPAEARAAEQVAEARRWLKKDAPEARRLAQAVLDATPSPSVRASAWMVLADAQRREGRRQAAVEIYGRVANDPQAPRYREEAALRQARLLRGLGRGTRALEVLTRSAADPQALLLEPERAALTARLHLDAGRPASAATALEATTDQTVALMRARVEVAERLDDADRGRRLLAPVLRARVPDSLRARAERQLEVYEGRR